MLVRLLTLCGLLVALAAAAEPQAGAVTAAATGAPADWKALACGALVALYMALRRSRWNAD